MTLDLLIRNGVVIDGAGGAARSLDVAVADGRIADLGELTGVGADCVIDAEGLVVAPGFIDIHTHCGFHSDRGMGINLNILE